MGAGASVLQGDDDAVMDLDTFALVQHEYRRLSINETTDEPLIALPSDEEVFTHLKGVVAQRYELKQQELRRVELTGDAVASEEAADDAATTAANEEEESVDHSPAEDAVDPSADAKPPRKSIQYKEGDDDTLDMKAVLAAEPVDLIHRPLTSDTLMALANSIPDDDVDGDVSPLLLAADTAAVLSTDSDKADGVTGGSAPYPFASLSEGSFGRSSAAMLTAQASQSSNSSSRAFDLSQNLTPVFTTDVLTDPTTLKMITSYAEKQQIAHGVDHIKFWVEIDELAQLPSHSYTHRRLRKIYDKFLSPEAPSPVCVTSSMLAEIETALHGDSISAGIYYDAQQVCLTALEQSVYPRFRENRLFKKMIEFCAPPPMSSKQLQHHNAAAAQAEAEDYSLQGILSHPAKLRFLKTYCMEALALENLLFYLEVEDCKRLPNLSFISNKTRKIYDRYCTPSSRNFLELPDAVLAELHAATEQRQPLFPKLFYEAQFLVFQRISDEIWKSFCRTGEYLEYSRRLKPERRKLPYARTKFTPEQSELLARKLESMNEFQLIETAMHYPVAKLIPLKTHADNADAGGPSVSVGDPGAVAPVFTPEEQLTILVSDSYGKKFFKQFMHKRGIDQFLAFCEEVDDFKLLPGIEFLQHTAKKIYRKYILPSAKLQVDMSRAMRDEIAQRLLNPSIDMFKRISQRVKQGMLQDSLPRFVKASFYTDLRKLAKQFKEAAVEADLKAIDAAAKKGKLELQHLDLLLQNQLSMKQFRLFLESQHCSENLMLYEEIEHFRRLPSYQIVLRSAKKIYDKYLNPSNTRNALIPLSEALRARVVAQLDAASRTTFDEVESECYEHMRNVVVPDFLDSRIFMALVGTWATVDEEYPAEMIKGEFEMAFLRHRFHLVQEARGLSRDTATPKGMLG